MMQTEQQKGKIDWSTINAIRVIVAALGVMFGISGMNHGFWEMLQGNISTGGLFISAIGEAHRMWVHGNEYAFTLIPNFLITGITAIIVGLLIIIWSVAFVHRKHGSLIFLLLFILILLVGGGVAQIIFFPLIVAVSTRINKPLDWWRIILPVSVRMVLAKLWLGFLIANLLLFSIVFEIGTFGFVPGVNDPDLVLTIMISILGVVLVILPLNFISGFAHNIKRQSNSN